MSLENLTSACGVILGKRSVSAQGMARPWILNYSPALSGCYRLPNCILHHSKPLKYYTLAIVRMQKQRREKQNSVSPFQVHVTLLPIPSERQLPWMAWRRSHLLSIHLGHSHNYTQNFMHRDVHN
jgi:hypothetical protein